jgi:hypothetical protein
MSPPARRAAVVALALAAALAACREVTVSEAPRSFAPQVAALAPVPAGLGRVVVARDDYVQGAFGVAQVAIGTLPPVALADGALVARDVPPGTYSIAIASSAFDPAPANAYAVTVLDGGVAWVRILYYQVVGETSVGGGTPTVREGGVGTIMPGMATPEGRFRVEEMPLELR